MCQSLTIPSSECAVVIREGCTEKQLQKTNYVADQGMVQVHHYLFLETRHGTQQDGSRQTKNARPIIALCIC